MRTLAGMMAQRQASQEWPEGERQFVRLSDLILHRDLQQREDLYAESWIKELSERLSAVPVERRGEQVKVPGVDPILVYAVEGALYVVDGFQRHEGHRREGFTWIYGEVVLGTWDEAWRRSLVVNNHGKQLSAADKRHKLLNAAQHWRAEIESGAMSFSEVARQTLLSVAFVSKTLRAEGFQVGGERTVTRGGQSYVMNTEHIGRPRKEKPAAAPDLPAIPPASFVSSDGDAAGSTANGNGHVNGAGPAHTATFVSPEPPMAEEADVWTPPAEVEQMDECETELVINVPASFVVELREIVLLHGSIRLQHALRGQLL